MEEILSGLRRIFQAAEGYARHAWADSGLTSPQAWALHVLAGETMVKVTELARRMYLHPSTVVGIVDRLEAKGFVVRGRDPSDRRLVLVTLTIEGRRVADRVPKVAQDYLLDGLGGLTGRDRKAVARGVALLVDILGAAKFPAKPILSGVDDPPPRRVKTRPEGERK